MFWCGASFGTWRARLIIFVRWRGCAIWTRCAGRSAIAARPAELLAPVINKNAESRLGQRSSPGNPSGVPGGDGVRLVRVQDAPVKAVCSAGAGVSDDATCLAFGVNEQLGAGANTTPLRCRMRWSTCLPGAQFTGKTAKVFSAVLWYADGYSSQPTRLKGTLFTH